MTVTTRTFTFKCEFCPTKVKVITDAPSEAAFDGEGHLIKHPYKPEYGVGGNSRDGDYATAQLCPSCGFMLKLA